MTYCYIHLAIAKALLFSLLVVVISSNMFTYSHTIRTLDHHTSQAKIKTIKYASRRDESFNFSIYLSLSFALVDNLYILFFFYHLPKSINKEKNTHKKEAGERFHLDKRAIFS